MLRVIDLDLDFLTVSWDFPHVDSSAPCAYCACTDTTGGFWPWNNFQKALPIRKPEEFLSGVHKTHKKLFPMYQIPGVTPMTACVDWVRAKYLGTDPYFFGVSFVRTV